jgi:DNA processing protein
MNLTWLDDETRALLTLHLLPGLGPRLTRALLNRFGSAAAVLEATAMDLSTVPYMPREVAERIALALQNRDLDGELALLEKHETELIRQGTPEYPIALSTLPDAPALLYLRGALIPEDANSVALVGSRSCTPYGRRITERLAQGLARAGFTVISGLARGIDGIAHRAALEAGGRTLAVLAGGLSRIYPPEHAELADAIAVHGALLSESPMALEPLPQMFPQRNRLISGLSRGVVIVEAAEKSGALLTAKHALDQGREVFAVPGNVDSEASSGTLRLIREGATLVRHVDDILEALEQLPPPERPAGTEVEDTAPAPPSRPQPSLTDAQRKVLDAISDAVAHADELVERTGLAVTEVGHSLVILEMYGLVRRLPGNRYEKR